MQTDEEKQINKEIGIRLRLLRQRRKMSQKVLANQSGVSYQQIQKYEKGKNRIFASRLYKFSCILNISPLYFFDNLPLY